MSYTSLICTLATWFAILSPNALAKDQRAASSEFAGSTPCGQVARQFLGIPADLNCVVVTWELSLEGESAEGDARQLKLTARCGLTVPGQPGQVQDAKESITIQGTWRISRGTKSDPQAVVYELSTSDDPKRSAALVRISDDVLHLLDDQRRAMPGNSGWSYALNRKGKEH